MEKKSYLCSLKLLHALACVRKGLFISRIININN